MPKILDLVGSIFQRLTVLERIGSQQSNGRSKVIWRCRCDCGSEVSLSSNALRSGNTRSCGCLVRDTAAETAKKHPLPPTTRDVTGLTFNRLTAMNPTGRRTRGSVVWLCLCQCGRTHEVALEYLVSGQIKSCGCIRGQSFVTHGASRKGRWTPEYAVWSGMMQRCHNPKSVRFKDYGARGITVCERWHSFQHFLMDMGPRPHGLTLDRSRNNEGYAPENCKWATHIEQNRNRRNNRVISWNGVEMCVAEWSDCTGLPAKAITNRLRRGWSIDRALSEDLK